MTRPEHSDDFEAEANRILAEMDDLRSQLVQATKSGQRPDLKILEQMEETSRRYREVSERRYRS